MSTENVSNEPKGNELNPLLAACCYQVEDGRFFNLLSDKQPPLRRLIMIDTYQNEILSAKAYRSFEGIEFKTELGIIERHEVKGWSFWQ